MENDPGKTLVLRVSLLALALCAVGAAPAWLLGGAGALWGLLGGLGLGLLSLGSILVTVSVSVRPPDEQHVAAGSRRVAMALHLLRYSLMIAGLYFLVAHCQVNAWAIFSGLLTPILALVLTETTAPARRRRPRRP